jgi:hypothetical protein
MTREEQLEIDTRIRALEEQRSVALTEAVLLRGKLAVALDSIRRLEDTLSLLQANGAEADQAGGDTGEGPESDGAC